MWTSSWMHAWKPPPHDSRPSHGRLSQLAGGSNPSRAVLNHSASHRSCVAPRCAKRFLSACCMHEHHRKRSRCSQWWVRSPPCGEGAHLSIAASAAAQRGHPPCLGPGGAGLGSRWQREEKRGVEFLGIPKANGGRLPGRGGRGQHGRPRANLKILTCTIVGLRVPIT